MGSRLSSERMGVRIEELFGIIKLAFNKKVIVRNSKLGEFFNLLRLVRAALPLGTPPDNLILGKYEQEVSQLIKLRENFYRDDDVHEIFSDGYDENSRLIIDYPNKAFTEDVPPEFNEIKEFVTGEMNKTGGYKRKKKRNKKRKSTKRKSMKRKSMKRNKKQIRKKTKRRKN